MNPISHSLIWAAFICLILGQRISYAQEYDVKIDPIHWKKMLDNVWEKDAYPCQINERSSNQSTKCEISIHGGFTRTYPKLSFKIETDKKSPPIGMHHKMILKAEWGDGTYLRNDLSFYVFKTYTSIPVVKRRPVILSINGNPYGIMIEQESINDSFLSDNGVKDAYLFKSDAPDDLYKGSAGSLIPLKFPSQYHLAYNASKDSEEHYDVLVNFIDDLWSAFINEIYPSHSSLFNEEQVTSFIAVMGVIQNFDYSKKNFFLSIGKNSPEQTMLIPYDVDITWGCSWINQEDSKACTTGSWNQDYQTGTLRRNAVSKYPNHKDTNLLYQIVWDNPASALKIRKKICSIINSDHYIEGLSGEIGRISSWIQAHQTQDRMGRLHGEAYRESVEQLRQFTVKRKEFLNQSMCRPLGL